MSAMLFITSVKMLKISVKLDFGYLNSVSTYEYLVPKLGEWSRANGSGKAL